jgi:transcriptional antiterminator NusG
MATRGITDEVNVVGSLVQEQMPKRPKGAKPVQMMETDVGLGVASAERDHAVGQATRIARGATTPAWHVLWTRSNCEQLVLEQLVGKGFHIFLPTIETWAKGREGRHRRRVPVFPGYLFLHHTLDRWSDVEVRKARGLVAILGEGWDRRAIVPDAEVDGIRTLVHSAQPVFPYPYLAAGQRVRITHGPLANVEGVLVRTRPDKGLLVVSVELLRRSVAVEVDCTFATPA